MPRPKNPKAGRGPCPNCSTPVLFRSSPSSGRISFTCDECDSAGYADPDSAAAKKWRASFVSSESAPSSTSSSEPTPASSPAPSAPAPRAAARAPAPAFGLEQL